MTRVATALVDGPFARGPRGDPGLIPFGDYVADTLYPPNAIVRHGGEIQWRALRKTDVEPSDSAPLDWVRFIDATPATAAADIATTARDQAVEAAGDAIAARDIAIAKADATTGDRAAVAADKTSVETIRNALLSITLGEHESDAAADAYAVAQGIVKPDGIEYQNTSTTPHIVRVWNGDVDAWEDQSADVQINRAAAVAAAAEAQGYRDEIAPGVAGGVATLDADGKVPLSQKRFVSSIAALRNLAVAVGALVATNGYYGDDTPGGSRYVGVNMGIAGTFVDDGGAVIVPTDGDGSQAWVMQPQIELCSTQYGAKHDVTVDDYGYFVAGINDTARLQAFIYAPARLGKKNFFPLPAAFTNLLMPDWDRTGYYWDWTGSFSLTGVKGLSALVQMPSADAGYAIAHPHMNSTAAPRGQHYGVTIRGMTLVGGCGQTKQMDGWGFENTTQLKMEDCRTYGFPRGRGAHLYAHANGGMYGTRFRDNVWGFQISTTYSGANFVDLTLMDKLGLEVGVHLDGPNGSTGAVGRCNDFWTDDRFFNCRVTHLLVQGHGDNGSGSSFNVELHQVTVTQEWKKIEEGTVSAAADASHVTLRADAPAANRAAGLYVNSVFATLDSSNRVVDWQVITADDGAGNLTLKGNLASGAPTGGVTKYRIGGVRVSDVVTDNELNPTHASFNFKALYSSVLWKTIDGQLRFYSWSEENYAGVIAAANASVDVWISGIPVVCEGAAWGTLDGSDSWRPKKASFGVAAGGQNGVSAETHFTGHLWMGDGQNAGNAWGIISSLTNNTTTRQLGECVRIGSSYQLAAPASTGLHVPLASRGTAPSAGYVNGKKAPIQFHGLTDIKLDLDASGNAPLQDWAVTQISGSNYFKAIDPETVTNWFKVVGRLALAYSGTGVVTAKSYIGPVGT